jgi:FdrA protein
MAVIKTDVRTGAYYDSAFLMQLQRSLAGLPGVQDAGVVMGTDSNKELLAHIDLVSPEAGKAKPDDLVIVVRADNEGAAVSAIGKVDELLTRKKQKSGEQRLPQSVEAAVQDMPDASWVLISVAGRYAASVARESLRLGKHVFLFSDNVSVEEEIELKKMAAEKGLLVMGPDCGTAIVSGNGLGFANKVRPGPIGVVAAAGTGLQQVSARIHQLGGGMTHGIGTGGRDLSEKVGAVTFKMAIDIMARDPETKVIVLVSKPPAARVADEVLAVAKKAGKPVVVVFIGRSPAERQSGNLYFAGSLDEAASLAVEISKTPAGKTPSIDLSKPAVPAFSAAELGIDRFAKGQKYLRGLFSGGTLAYEAQYILQDYLPKVWANAPLNKEYKIKDSLVSEEHTIIDLGEDEFTVGRLHPMMDNELRVRRLLEEAKDPSVAVIMLDVVIGYGSHEDPACELAAAVVKAKEMAKKEGRFLEVVAVVTGTDLDPQNLNSQIAQMKKAGAWVETSNERMVRYAGQLLNALNGYGKIPAPAPKAAAAAASEYKPTPAAKPVDLSTLQKALSAINVGLESFAANLVAQDVPTIQVEWRPPAGGNEKLMAILERMKANQAKYS